MLGGHKVDIPDLMIEPQMGHTWFFRVPIKTLGFA
jgi:hypothetical protein